MPWRNEFEFENWAVIALGGIPNKVQVGDTGVIGVTSPYTNSAGSTLFFRLRH